MIDNIFIEEVKDLNKIENIIKKFDNCFVPTLSERIYDLEKYAKKLYDNAITIQASLDNQIVGFASFYCNDYNTYTGYLTQIAVLEHLRGYKIGIKLLKIVIEKCLKENMKYLKLEVYEHNEHAIQFYKNYGFKELENASKTSIYLIKKLEEK